MSGIGKLKNLLWPPLALGKRLCRWMAPQLDHATCCLAVRFEHASIIYILNLHSNTYLVLPSPPNLLFWKDVITEMLSLFWIVLTLDPAKQ